MPGVAEPDATKVATPVVRSTVHAPSPVMAKVALHTESEGSIRQGPLVLPVCSDAPVARAPCPVTRLLNVAVPPGMTGFVSGVATGSAGSVTVGVMRADAACPVSSCTM